MHCFGCESDSRVDSETCEVCGKPFDTDADRYFRAGMNALLSGEVDLSTRLLEDCVKLNPSHLSGRYNLGLALCMADRCDEAMAHYMAVAEIEPNYPGIYTVLGQATFGDYLYHMEMAESKRTETFDLLTKAISQDPGDVDAYFSLANAYMAIGSAREALPWLKKAMELDPGSSAIFYALGKAYKMLRRDSEAADMARQAMDLSKADDPLHEDIEMLCAECEVA